jgi:acetyltransferase-like isoleucine patch superfamily enzyme
MRPLAAFKVRRLELGDYTVTDPLLLVNCTYGPRSELKTGRHCYLQSFSMLEPSEGIFLGDHVALGGQCLVFCHGSWANYLRGAPYARGPVRIGNEVWVSWRSMILANSRIGDRAIIGAHSMVNGDLAANALYAGVPARMVVENVWKDLSPADRDARMREIIAAFGRDFPEYEKLEFKEFDATVPALSGAEPAIYYSFTAVRGAAGGRMTVVDLDRLVTYGSEKGGQEFAEFLTSYGIRTDRKNLSDLR